MITCDRCKKTILESENFTYVSVELIACVDCNKEFRSAVDKITDEIRAERTARIDKFRNEWLRNFSGNNEASNEQNRR